MVRVQKFYVAHCQSALCGEYDLEAETKKELHEMIRERVIKNFERIRFSVEERLEYQHEGSF